MIHYDEVDQLIKLYASERHSQVPPNFFVPDIKFARQARAFVLTLLGIITTVCVWKIYYYLMQTKLILIEAITGSLNEAQYEVIDELCPNRSIILMNRTQFIKFECLFIITEGAFSVFQRFRSIPAFVNGQEQLNYSLGISKRINWFILFFILFYSFIFISLSQKKYDFNNPAHREKLISEEIHKGIYGNCGDHEALLRARTTYKNVGRNMSPDLRDFEKGVKEFSFYSGLITSGCRALRHARAEYGNNPQRAMNDSHIKWILENYPTLKARVIQDIKAGKFPMRFQ